MNAFKSSARTGSTSKSCRLSVETLEARDVPAASLIRSIDGTGNNLTHPEWGSTTEQFIRIAQPEYADGVSAPAGAERPSAREISNAVADQEGEDIHSDTGLSAMIYAWGQFIDHDLDLTFTNSAEPMSIAVPTGDPSFDPNGTGTQVIRTSRSVSDPATGTGIDNPRQQVNAITSWIDASMIYGSDAATAASLRTFSKGQLKTSGDGLLPVGPDGQFLAGDVRVNENPGLISLQTLFVREHNYRANAIARSSPRMTDEQVYQAARNIVIGEIQAITYNHWLPAVLGKNALDRYTGYKPNVNPSISNEFSTAGFRFGHSLLGDDVEFLDNNGISIRDGVALKDAFFNPALVAETNIDPILKYLASDPSSQVDTKVVDGVRNFLFGPPGAGGLDLASLNIQRGRDHGLADYNATRLAYGLPAVTSFAQITSDTEVASKLQQLYGNVENVDLWVGALAENHVSGASVGPTLRAIISDQFERVRDGDRFWYQRSLGGAQLAAISRTTLTEVIKRNTDLTKLQVNAFFFKAEISGIAFNDLNRDGRKTGPERGRAGVTLELVNLATNEVVGTTLTDLTGAYKFNVAGGLRTGDYIIRAVPPQTSNGQNAPPPHVVSRVIHITKGDTIVKAVNLALPPGPPPSGPGGPGL